VRRTAHVAALLADAGAVAIVSLVSPYAADRAAARAIHAALDIPFVEVFVDTPLEECERRDRKGLYARARTGEIPNFTGISDPYEVPQAPDVRIGADESLTDKGPKAIIDKLERLAAVPSGPAASGVRP
jgi:adenylylsulfate kinase-like enzyme